MKLSGIAQNGTGGALRARPRGGSMLVRKDAEGHGRSGTFKAASSFLDP